MGRESLSTIFISHGPPSLLLEDIPANKFLKDIGKNYRGINAVLCISAHWMTAKPTVSAALRPPRLSMTFMGFHPNFTD